VAARRGEDLRPPVFGSAISLFLIALAALSVLLPLGEGLVVSLLASHLVLVPVYFLTLRPVEGVGPVGAFVGGLGVDVLGAAPLGLTAASLLAVHMALRQERETLLALPAVFRLSGFALAAGFMLAVSSLAMAVLGPGRVPDPGEAALVFLGLLAIAVGVEFLNYIVAPGAKSDRPGRGLRKKLRRRQGLRGSRGGRAAAAGKAIKRWPAMRRGLAGRRQ